MREAAGRGDIPVCGCGCGGELPRGLYKGHTRRFLHGHNAAMSRLAAPAAEDRGYASPCLIWQGAIMTNGYGREGRGLAHKKAWERVHGPVPKGRELDHLCRVRCCVNPAHLEPVTRLVNIERGAAAKLTRVDAMNIREASASGARNCDLAIRFGISRPTISRIVNRKSWKEAA